MKWQDFLRVALQNASYAAQLVQLLPIANGPVKAALVVVINHAAAHADCITELVDKLSQVLLFGATVSESEYSANLQPIAEEITYLRKALAEIA